MGSIGFARIKRHTIPVLLLTTIIICIAAFFLISSFFGRMEERFSEKMEDALFFQATAASDILKEHVLREIDEVENLAEKIALKTGDQKAHLSIFVEHMKREKKQGESVEGGFITDKGGSIQFAFPDTLADSVPGPFRKRLIQMAAQSGSRGGVGFVELTNGRVMLAISRPVRGLFFDGSRKGGPDGYVTVFYSFEKIHQLYLGGFPAWVIASNIGYLDFHGWDLDWKKGTFNLSDTGVPDSIKGVGWELMSGRPGRKKFRHNGTSYIMAYAPVVIPSGENLTNISISLSGADFLVSIGIFQDENVFRKDTRLTQKDVFIVAGTFLAAILFLGWAVFLTYRNRAADDRRLHNAQLQTVREIAGGAAHHISQPMTAIYGNLSLMRMILRKNPPDMEGQLLKKLTSIQDEAEAVAKIVEEMKGVMEYRAEKYVGKSRITVFSRKKSD